MSGQAALTAGQLETAECLPQLVQHFADSVGRVLTRIVEVRPATYSCQVRSLEATTLIHFVRS